MQWRHVTGTLAARRKEVRKPVFRTLAVGLVAVGALAGTGLTPVHASSSSFTDVTNDVIDPLLAQNTMVAPRSTNPRLYADLTSVNVTSAGGVVTFTVTVNGNVPTFPVSNGDAGVEINACFDIPNARPIANGPVVVGTGHHGAPVFDGPYNSRYGWKVCAWVNASAGGTANIDDCGVALFDPIGQYTFFDKAQITNAGFICPPVTGHSSFAFQFPYTWTTIVEPPSTPEQGIVRHENRTFLASGDVVSNLTVSSQVTANVTLPSPVCEPVECNLVGPIQGVGGLLITVDWAPGRQYCDPPFTSCVNDDGGSLEGDGYTLGTVPLGFPAGAVQDCDAGNPEASCPVPSTTGNPPTVGTVPYDPCFSGQGSESQQDNGDLYAALSLAGQGSLCTQHGPIPWPYEYHTVNGRTLVPGTPMYTNDSAGFTAA
jgi:hypothetical protein